MIAWDVMNGLARRSWARNKAAVSTIARAARADDMLEVTSPSLVDAGVLDRIFEHPR
jgi:urocanate hydratase